MDMKMLVLKKDIEATRENLYKLVCFNDLTDENVVSCSKKLDNLLNKYGNLEAHS